MSDMSFLGLNRPEYVPSPDLALTELVWSAMGGEAREVLKKIAPKGIAFGANSKVRGNKYLYTKPLSDEDSYSELGKLAAQLLNGQRSIQQSDFVDVFLEELEVFGGQRAKSSMASPLTLELALLQDRRGITGKKNPSNVALILEQIFLLGGHEGNAAACLVEAYHRGGCHGIPDWLPEFSNKILSKEVQELVRQFREQRPLVVPEIRRKPLWLKEYRNTPFEWFGNAWKSLCEGEWINSMPRRRWTDWATCVSRTGIATAFLFEMHLNYRMVSALIVDRDAGELVSEIFLDGQRLMSWDHRRSRSAQNVAPRIHQLTKYGTSCQKCLADLKGKFRELPEPSQYDDRRDGLTEWLNDARAFLKPHATMAKADIADALDEAPLASAKNVKETISYSLTDRGGDQFVDLYCLLRRAGPTLWIEPAQEWLVTIASLCAPEPGRQIRLGDLLTALSSMGIAASPATIVPKLELYGLCRSSHDADDAIEIQPAF